MAFKINDSKDLPYIRVAFSGRHDDAELGQYQNAIFSSSGFLHRDQLIDYSAVDDYKITSKGLETYAECARNRQETKDISAKRQLALVSTVDLIFGMSRVFIAHANRILGNYLVFRPSEEARAWFAEPREPSTLKKQRRRHKTRTR